MFGMSDDVWFRVVSFTYFSAASLSILAGVAQYMIGNRISDRKDAELAQYKVEAASKLVDAQKQAALANKAAAELNEKAANLESDNLKLKKQLAWRTLNSNQKMEIVNKLRLLQGVDAALTSVMGDAEGLNYASQFVEIIRASGWSLPDTNVIQAAFVGSPPVGVEICINQADRGDQRINNILNALVSILFQEGIISERRVQTRPDVPQGRVQLMIGVKPPFGTHE